MDLDESSLTYTSQWNLGPEPVLSERGIFTLSSEYLTAFPAQPSPGYREAFALALIWHFNIFLKQALLFTNKANSVKVMILVSTGEVPKYQRISLSAFQASGFSGWSKIFVKFGCEEQLRIYS